MMEGLRSETIANIRGDGGPLKDRSNFDNNRDYLLRYFYDLLKRTPDTTVQDTIVDIIKLQKESLSKKDGNSCIDDEIISLIIREIYSEAPEEVKKKVTINFNEFESGSLGFNNVDYSKVFTRKEAAEFIQRKENTISTRVQNNKIIGYKSGSSLLIPAWQFESGAVRAGIKEVLDIWEENGVLALRNVSTPLEFLNGKTIAQCIVIGDTSLAIQAAERLKGE